MKKTQVAVGKRGGKIAGYHIVHGKQVPIYVGNGVEGAGKAIKAELNRGDTEKEHAAGLMQSDRARKVLREAGQAYSDVANGKLRPDVARDRMTELSRGPMAQAVLDMKSLARKHPHLKMYLSEVEQHRDDLNKLRKLHDEDMAAGKSGPGTVPVTAKQGASFTKADLAWIKMGRKDVSWTSGPKTDFEKLPQALQHKIVDLKVIDLGHSKYPTDSIYSPTPQFFVGKVNGKYFLINTEGSDYARYKTELRPFPDSEGEKERVRAASGRVHTLEEDAEERDERDAEERKETRTKKVEPEVKEALESVVRLTRSADEAVAGAEALVKDHKVGTTNHWARSEFEHLHGRIHRALMRVDKLTRDFPEIGGEGVAGLQKRYNRLNELFKEAGQFVETASARADKGGKPKNSPSPNESSRAETETSPTRDRDDHITDLLTEHKGDRKKVLAAVMSTRVFNDAKKARKAIRKAHAAMSMTKSLSSSNPHTWADGVLEG